MKIRTNFVSNSSSTSFCIFGICTNDGELADRLHRVKGIVRYCSPSDWYYCGGDLASMDDDETFGQFKSRVKELIEKAAGKDISEPFEILEESWYDG